MILIQIKQRGEAAVMKAITTLPDRVLQAMRIGLERGLLGAVAVAQLEYLSGPRPEKLQAVSGRLRQNVSSQVEIKGDRVVGLIGANVPYAAFHEFGFHGSMNVRQHQRVTRVFALATGADIEIRRQVISDRGDFLGFKESRGRALARLKRKGLTPGFNSVTVRAHSRKVNYAGRPFIQPALNKCMGPILDSIRAELQLVSNQSGTQT